MLGQHMIAGADLRNGQLVVLRTDGRVYPADTEAATSQTVQCGDGGNAPRVLRLDQCPEIIRVIVEAEIWRQERQRASAPIWAYFPHTDGST